MTRGARIGVGLGLLLAWASLGRVTRVDGMPYAPWGLDAVPMNGAVAMVATLGFLAAWGAFVSKRFPDVGAAAMIVLLAVGTKGMEWQSPPGMGVNGATMLPGAALSAWWIARRTTRDPAEQERRGIEAACGLVAAGYGVAVASKLYTSGLGWASAGNIGLQIATQGYLVPEPLQSLRLAAAASAPLCHVLGVGTILIEGGALLFVFPAARRVAIVGLIAMHVGIGVLMGLHHYDWMFTAVGWGTATALPRVARRVPGAVARHPDLPAGRLEPDARCRSRRGTVPGVPHPPPEARGEEGREAAPPTRRP